MKFNKLMVMGVVLLLYSLTLFNGLITANQQGSLPTGEFWLDDSSIIQTQADYSFFYELNEHTIGEDNSRYKHYFEIFLDINVTDFNNFFIIFDFSTPFETLMGGGGGLVLPGLPFEELNFTYPSFNDQSIFQYTFTPINTTSFVGTIMIKMTVTTTGEMNVVRGTEIFGIELTNGTIYSERVIEFQMAQIVYSTTEGPDNVFIPVDFIAIFFTMLVLPIIRKHKQKARFKLFK
jgi:hypothetical protein